MILHQRVVLDLVSTLIAPLYLEHCFSDAGTGTVVLGRNVISNLNLPVTAGPLLANFLFRALVVISVMIYLLLHSDTGHSPTELYQTLMGLAVRN